MSEQTRSELGRRWPTFSKSMPFATVSRRPGSRDSSRTLPSSSRTCRPKPGRSYFATS
jgi:hypothetical protein